MRNLFKSFVKFFYREPDVFIGGRENTYLRRWWVIPRNNVLNIYLHQFLRSDDDRAPHDHPWNNCSVRLRGSYYEHVPANPATFGQIIRYEDKIVAIDLDAGIPSDLGKELVPVYDTEMKKILRRAPSLVFRHATDAHRIELLPDGKGGLKTAWSLFITGPWLRSWGFWCRNKGFVPHANFLDARDSTQSGHESVVGAGCGE